MLKRSYIMRGIIALFLCTMGFAAVRAQNPIYYLLIGTYTHEPSKSEGIYVYRFNPNKGEATFVSKATGISNPSYLAISKDQKYVYAVNEDHGDNGGSVSAFTFDKAKGELHLLNKQPSGGDGPAYISIDSSGKNVAVANYGGGNLSVLKTNADGSLQPLAQTIAHDGYGVNVKRQEMPHPHCTVFSPDEKYLFSADLGNDRLYRYSFNPSDASNPLQALDPAYYEVPDGSGPRHLLFHPNKKYAYLINELSGKLIAYSYNDGTLKEIQTIASDNTPDKEDKASADIHMTSDGKFLYTSNRGKANDITIYKLNSDGTLIEVGHQAVGQHPRNFIIDPSNHFVLVACRDSNTIQIFTINKNFGFLTDTGVKIDVDQPACLKMMPMR